MRTDAREGGTLRGRRVLVTGIVDESSLALHVAQTLQSAGADLVCAGLGPTPHRTGLSERAARHMQASYEVFEKTVDTMLGSGVGRLPWDVAADGSIEDVATWLEERDLALDGVLHAVAFDRTIGRSEGTGLLGTSRADFLECMSVSAWSLIGLLRALVDRDRLRADSAVVALSYIAAERVVPHRYDNIALAKAALERAATQLAVELASPLGVRVNVVRFSPYSASRAGGAIPGLSDAERHAAERAPLGNARPEALGHEVVHLMRPEAAITGEIRHVDGGYHVMA